MNRSTARVGLHSVSTCGVMNTSVNVPHARSHGGLVLAVLAAAAMALAGCTTQTSAAKPSSPAKRAEIHADLALGYMKRGQDDIAAQELKHALEMSPNHPRSNYYMAKLKTRGQELDEAEKYYRAAIDADPKYSEALHDYAALLCARGNRDKAMKFFDRALADTGYASRPLAFQHLGECLYNTPPRDAAGAEKSLRAALDLNPNLPAALRLMAQISFDGGKWLSARGFIERYFSTRQDSPAALLLAVKIERALKNEPAANRYATKLMSAYPKSPEARSLDVPRGRK